MSTAAQIFCTIVAGAWAFICLWASFKAGYLLGMRQAWKRVEVKRKMTVDSRTKEVIADRMIVTQSGPARVFYINTEMEVDKGDDR